MDNQAISSTRQIDERIRAVESAGMGFARLAKVVSHLFTAKNILGQSFYPLISVTLYPILYQLTGKIQPLSPLGWATATFKADLLSRRHNKPPHPHLTIIRPHTNFNRASKRIQPRGQLVDGNTLHPPPQNLRKRRLIRAAKPRRPILTTPKSRKNNFILKSNQIIFEINFNIRSLITSGQLTCPL